MWVGVSSHERAARKWDLEMGLRVAANELQAASKCDQLRDLGVDREPLCGI